jgi:hypothetical protein
VAPPHVAADTSASTSGAPVSVTASPAGASAAATGASAAQPVRWEPVTYLVADKLIAADLVPAAAPASGKGKRTAKRAALSAKSQPLLRKVIQSDPRRADIFRQGNGKGRVWEIRVDAWPHLLAVLCQVFRVTRARDGSVALVHKGPALPSAGPAGH